MNRTQLYLPKTQLDTLRKVAKQKKSTVSAVVRYFIGQQLSNNENKKSPSDSLFAISQKINKLGAKAPKNLSEKIDSYAYGSN